MRLVRLPTQLPGQLRIDGFPLRFLCLALRPILQFFSPESTICSTIWAILRLQLFWWLLCTSWIGPSADSTGFRGLRWNSQVFSALPCFVLLRWLTEYISRIRGMIALPTKWLLNLAIYWPHGIHITWFLHIVSCVQSLCTRNSTMQKSRSPRHYRAKSHPSATYILSISQEARGK